MNRQVFGRWASPYNHGHNYKLWVTAEGAIDTESGMVVNIKWMDDILQDLVVKRFDQKSLPDEIEYFQSNPTTLESILAYLQPQIQHALDPLDVVEMKLEESELLYGEWIKQDKMTLLTRTYEFAASHRLHVPTLSDEENIAQFGKCNNPQGHGHNYILEVSVTGEINQETGMMVSLEELDRVVEKEVVDRYDHKNLDYDVPELAGKNTTSELVTLAIFDRLKGKLPAELVRVRVYETARNMFEVTR